MENTSRGQYDLKREQEVQKATRSLSALDIKDAMPLWLELNDLRWKVFTGQEIDEGDISIDKLRPKLKGDCPLELQKAILYLLQNIKKIPVQDRFVWLSSNCFNHTCPPIRLEETGSYTPKMMSDQNLSSLEHETFRDYPELQPFSNSNMRVLKKKTSLIQQHPQIGDCSFVCSLVNLKKNSDCPKIIKSKNIPNTYLLNLHFNGSDNRLVSTPDVSKIPTSSVSGDQLSLESNDVADKILEQAYLRFKGNSYEHVGSNTAIDTFLLSGYIPEFIKLRELSSWNKLLSYYRSGLCTIAFGTKSKFENSNSEFIVSHDYIIGEFFEKEIKLVNPLQSDRLILIEKWETLLQFFDVAYINWNSKKMFKFHDRIHFKYNTSVSNKYPRSSLENPIFIVENNSKYEETVFVLLEKHLSNDMAYINVSIVENCITSFIPTKYKNNTGFDLLKFTIKQNETRKLCCFSDKSSHFTIHLYKLSPLISFKKLDYKSIAIANGLFMNNWTNHHERYCQNPSYILSFKSNSENASNETSCTFQILSENIDLNLQLYNMDDFKLENPLIHHLDYQIGLQTHNDIQLDTTKKYKVVCSSKDSIYGSEFRIGCSCNNDFFKPILTEYYLYFGGDYRLSLKLNPFLINNSQNHKKFKLSLNTSMGYMSETWNIRLFENKEATYYSKHIQWSLKINNRSDNTNLVFNPKILQNVHGNSIAGIKINNKGSKIDHLVLMLDVSGDDLTLFDEMELEIGSLYVLSV